MIKPELDNPTFLAWAAAWLDSEGSIGVYYRPTARPEGQYFVKVSITQIVRAPLVILKQAFGGFITNRRVGQLVWQHQLGVRAVRILRPYLTVKGQQADLVLQFASLRDANPRVVPEVAKQFESIKLQLHSLNRWSDKRRSKLSAAMTGGRWARHYDACIECGTRSGYNAGGGRCQRCYSNHYYRKTH